MIARSLKCALLAFLVIHSGKPLRAVEGMWLPMFLETLNQSEMQQLGFRLSAADIYSINQSSLKDAIVSFGGGCTAELISGNGLLLTNHHCGYGAIQSHSSVADDLLTKGFWASDRASEKKNADLTALFVRRMEDVTEQVLLGLVPTGDAAAFRTELEARKKLLIEKARAEWAGVLPSWEFELRAFDYGNQYVLIATETYLDVRLVGAPPSSIGKFGSDTDNWVWPRHTGDFSLFRIYADAENRPAPPSEINQALNSPSFLSIELGGIRPGDFSMVYGFPGFTQEYLPREGLRQIVEIEDSIRVGVRDVRLAVLDERMRKSDALRIRYAASYASIANGWKKWIGEMQGVRRTKGLERKENFDRKLTERALESEAMSNSYAQLEYRFDSVYALRNPLLRQRTAYSEVFLAGSPLYRSMGQCAALCLKFKDSDSASPDELLRLAEILEIASDTAGYRIERETALQTFALYDRYTRGTKRFEAFDRWASSGSTAKAWDDLYGKSMLSNPKKAEKWLKKVEKSPGAALELLEKDPLYAFWKSGSDWYTDEVRSPSVSIETKLTALMAERTQMIRILAPEHRFYPDANSTLRLAYGQVSGFSPRDGVEYAHQTYLSGMIAKYIPGDYEFDLPEKLIELDRSKDFGVYGENGKLPMCFIASNHTTGGNSGSPALNAQGRLVGLNFDRVWEGTMSDVNYDASICRNIMVDIRFVLFVVDRFANSGYLLEEMDLYMNGLAI